eukprot:347489-Chlamydomonas_euryale.AAC.4
MASSRTSRSSSSRSTPPDDGPRSRARAARRLHGASLTPRSPSSLDRPSRARPWRLHPAVGGNALPRRSPTAAATGDTPAARGGSGKQHKHTKNFWQRGCIAR